MKSKRSILLIAFTVLLAIRCKDKFVPELDEAASNFLVVEGYINANGYTIIDLGRTVPINDTTNRKAEPGAKLEIIGDNNSTFRLQERETGVYQSDSLILARNVQYRLRITTNNGREYLSEYTPVKATPPIDNILWQLEDDGIQFYVNTHDPQNNTRYYKWDYEETWEINSSFRSDYRYDGANNEVLPRRSSQVDSLYYCWGFRRSTNLLLGSTIQLTSDVVNMQPLFFIPSSSIKTAVRYSLLLKQTSLERKAYDFYRLMQSNTESIGSVFDPLPTELPGNITCVDNPAEKVIGYVSASTVEEKRIFVTRNEAKSTYNPGCHTTYVINNRDSFALYFGSGGLVPYSGNGSPPAPIVGYYASENRCSDCRVFGSNIKPSYW
jgi:hypothetical protein